MTLSPTELSRLCDEHARRDAERSREVLDIGPFRALLNPSDPMIWLNYAVPIGPIGSEEEAAAALAQLREAFAARQRTLRFEFNALPWPGLPELLAREGLEVVYRHPVMVCTAETWRPFDAQGVEMRILGEGSPEADLRDYLTIIRLGFDDDKPVSPEDVIALRDRLRSARNVSALAALDGQTAGVGSISPIDGTAELAGVATHPAMRRRGVAAALSSFLMGHHFTHGGDLIWLSAADAAAQAVYQKVGFSEIDVRLNY